MHSIRPMHPPAIDNDDADNGPVDSTGTDATTVVIEEQFSNTPSVAGTQDVLAANTSCIKKRCPFLNRFSSYMLGVLLILCVTVIWVASSNWIQYIFGSLNYSKPYFLTYFNTTGFSLWNLGYFLVPKWTRVPWDDRERPQPIFVENSDLLLETDADRNSTFLGRVPRRHHRGDGGADDAEADEPDYGADIRAWAVSNGYNPAISSSNDEELSTMSHMSVEEVVDVGSIPNVTAAAAGADGSRGRRSDERGPPPFSDRAEVPLPRRRLARVERVRPYARRTIWFWAAMFCPFWFFANYLFNVSLSITSVASNTVLSATSSIWTLLLSYLLLHESLGPLKWLAVACCVAGSIMVGLSDNESDAEGGENTVVGDVIALVSAFFYAVYTTILRYGLPDDERYAMGMVFGAVGVINFICLWPGLVLVDLLSWEKFVWPTIAQFWPLALNALIGTNLSDVLWARSVVLTSPVVATLGLALTTPLAMVVDALFKGSRFSVGYITGAVLVMCGFVLVNIPILERWPACMRRWWS